MFEIALVVVFILVGAALAFVLLVAAGQGTGR